MAIKRIQKLDKRHAGRLSFAYFVEPDATAYDKLVVLQQWREWCWENFGAGCERDLAFRLRDSHTLRWGWDTEHGHCRLYLTEDALTFFKLKWS
jgi:hypothetical protein